MSLSPINSIKLSETLFIVENGDISILYAPLDKKAVLLKQKGKFALINHYLKEEENTQLVGYLKNLGIEQSFPMMPIYFGKYDLTTLTISLTSACNLRCVYCYARAGLNASTMNFAIAKTAIDYIVKNAIKRKEEDIKIIFHGGGESLVVFPLLKEVVKYAESVWGGNIKFSIVTNGTLLSQEVVKYFKSKDFKVTVSMDGPKQIQNSQRPKADGSGSFDDCIKGLSNLNAFGYKNFIIRSTITDSNVDKLNELLEIAKSFNAKLKVEPVTPTGRGEKNFKNLSSEKFLRYYREARKYAEEIDVELTSTFDNDFTPRANFCGGNGRMFCVLPDGEITSCSRVTRKDDFLAEEYFVGRIKNDEVVTDDAKIRSLQKLSVLNFPQCKDCFAKWYCAGGCHATRLSNNMVMPKEHCEIMQNLLWDNLIKQINQDSD
jgi:uncharacterized protein